MPNILIAIAAVLALGLAVRSCSAPDEDDRTAGLNEHIAMLVEGKRNAYSEADEFEFDRAIAAAVAERAALR